MSEGWPLEHIWIEPESETASPAAVIVLHGRGANEEDLLPLARQLPDELGIISARAPDELGPGYTWYQLDLSGGGLHASQPDAADFDRSLSLVSELMEAAVGEYGLDPDRVGLLGFSQGAILSLGLLAEIPDRISWVVGLHGYLPARYEAADLQAATGTPVFLGAGTLDEVIPETRAEDAADRLEAAGVAVTYRTYRIGHGTAPSEVEDVTEWVRDRLADP